MAIEAQTYHDNNLGLPISSQDYFFLSNNNNNMNNNMNNNNLLYNGFGLNELSYNNLQQLQYHQQQQQYVNHLQNMQKRNFSMNHGSFMNQQPLKKQKVENNNTTTTTTTSAITSESDNQRSLNFSQSISMEIEKQSKEIDRFINLQNERLKLALQEQRKFQLREIMKKFEAKAMQMLRQKDDEIAMATKKSFELQELLNKLELENQAWQKVALENEAMVISLNKTIEQLKEQQQLQQGCSSSNCVDDVESCCNISDNNKNNEVSKTEENRGINMCKVCNCENASVLMLPCRHLCSCKVCDVVLDACPVCKSPKMASFEALISSW